MMVPTTFPRHLWPLSTHLFQRRLWLGRYDLFELGQRLGTPVYVYDLPTLDHMISAYRHGLQFWPGQGLITFASKAWLSLPLVQLLTWRGLGLDVVSEGELEIARLGGMDGEKIHLHGNNKSLALLTKAIAVGVGAIVVDNLQELALLERLSLTKPQRLWLRLNPDLMAATHAYRQTGHYGSKFGLTWEEAQEAVQRIVANEHLMLTGLHTHIGSQLFEFEPILKAFERLIDLAAWIQRRFGLSIRYISPGGGLGVAYHPQDPKRELFPLVRDLCVFAARSWRQRLGESFPILVLEPGRSLIARAGMALYSVGNIRYLSNGERIIAVDGGLSDNSRPALYGAKYTAVLARDPLGEPVGPARIVGPLCESGDFLIKSVMLPEVQPGDVLAIPVSGAYQLSMASNYNGMLRPSVFLHTRATLIPMQRREQFEDLWRRDVLLPEKQMV